MRRTILAVIVVAMAATGCAAAATYPALTLPQNDGANADLGGVLHLRNAFLLSGTDPASPAPQQHLYAVLINTGNQPTRLEQVTVDGGGSVQLAGPVTLPPNRPVGTGNKPIGTVTGIRGNTVPMTFSFRGFEPLRVNVPVKSRIGQYTGLTP
ncbi:hypothetical protein ACFLIM_15300 [Nonomuraea sp. M3C6]|uniref:Copper(I)-binding protein n=1 Tax=Nonomuraea marmarensis TaxID=3351344 RepID=A0ABW7AB25_9ACTN